MKKLLADEALNIDVRLIPAKELKSDIKRYLKHKEKVEKKNNKKKV